MNASLILTQPQAEAVYSAMCALNNVSGAQLQTIIPATTGAVRVREMPSGTIAVEYLLRSQAPDGMWLETHADQAAFATAYALNSDEPQSDVAAAAGGLTQTAVER